MAKVVEQHLLDLLKEHAESKKVQVNEQHGFRNDHSTTHQLTRGVQFIKAGNEKQQNTGGVFLDISKAFDKVWRNGHIYKLIKHNHPLYLIQTTASYLKKPQIQDKIQRSILKRIPNQIRSPSRISIGTTPLQHIRGRLPQSHTNRNDNPIRKRHSYTILKRKHRSR